jgi:recombination protein RecT
MSAALEKTKIEMSQPVGRGSTVNALMEAYRRAFMLAAPKHLDVSRFLRIVISDVSRNRDLLECTSGSLFAAVMTAVQLGLEIGVMGQAYLVPFWNKKAKPHRREVQLIPGYRGLVQLARNSGELSTIWANVVFKGDQFTYEEGLERVLKHIPNDEQEEDFRNITHAYAVAKFKDGGFQLDVMRRVRIDRIRRMSQAPDSPAWTNHFDEMAKKTVLRRMSKLLPLSIEMNLAIRLDEKHALGQPQDINLVDTGGDVPMIEISGDDFEAETIDAGTLEESRGSLDVHTFRAGETKNRGHGQENLDALKTTTQVNGSSPLEQQLQSSVDTLLCDADDFHDIEVLALDCGVRMPQVLEHIMTTMGFKPAEKLPKSRKEEAIKWIQAHRKG